MIKFEVENMLGKKREVELRDYIEQSFEGFGYESGRIERMSDDLYHFKSKMVDFIEMLVEEDIISPKQLKKVF